MTQLVLSTSEFLALEETILVYPNPSQDYFQISHSLTPSGTISIYNNLGQKIKTVFSGNLATTKKERFSISDLDTGIYFVKIQSGKQAFLKSLLVK